MPSRSHRSFNDAGQPLRRRLRGNGSTNGGTEATGTNGGVPLMPPTAALAGGGGPHIPPARFKKGWGGHNYPPVRFKSGLCVTSRPASTGPLRGPSSAAHSERLGNLVTPVRPRFTVPPFVSPFSPCPPFPPGPKRSRTISTRRLLY